MLNAQRIMAFAATSAPARAKDFYEQVLGLTLVDDGPYALAFDANGTTLRLQKVEDFRPQPFTVLGWQVLGLAEIVDALVERGVRMSRFPGMEQDVRGIWTSPSGARVAWFADPDGNVLSLTQL